MGIDPFGKTAADWQQNHSKGTLLLPINKAV
jgi:hypothetical protein